ncbi:MAG: arsenite methyltransferase [Phycisphaerales bacterium]
MTTTNEAVRKTVREEYGAMARGAGDRCGEATPVGGCCCSGARKQPLSSDFLAEQIGYAKEELAELPEGANLGLSCGNPTAIAGLEEGMMVLDLGSGGGFDVFLAGPRVGAGGRVIGVDMTSDMIELARKNTASYVKATGLRNVEFRLGEIEHLPVADGSVDVVISNCVINLSPDKEQVWREIARVLKPGGRVAASDMALLRPLPPEVKEMVSALVGCVAGAVMMEEYRGMVEAAGLKDVTLTAKQGYVEALVNSGDGLYQAIMEKLPAGMGAADYVASVDVTARKGCGCAPGSSCC